MAYVIKFFFALLWFIASTGLGVIAAYLLHRWMVGPLYFTPPPGIIVGAAFVAWIAWRRAPDPERVRHFFGGGPKPKP